MMVSSKQHIRVILKTSPHRSWVKIRRGASLGARITETAEAACVGARERGLKRKGWRKAGRERCRAITGNLTTSGLLPAE